MIVSDPPPDDDGPPSQYASHLPTALDELVLDLHLLRLTREFAAPDQIGNPLTL